jgi:hypothetical protein
MITPIKFSEITQHFWRPKDIEARLALVSTRQIADLAERGIISPVIDADGRGTTRIYDGAGLYSIVLGQVTRMFLNHNDLKTFIQIILDKEKTAINAKEPDVPIMCLIKYETKGDFTVNFIYEIVTELWIANNIRDYGRYLINLHSIKYNLKKNSLS